MPPSSPLPTSPLPDTPSFRTHLSHLNARSTLLLKSSKSAIHAAEQVLGLLGELERAERGLWERLGEVGGLLGVDSFVDGSGNGGGREDLFAQLKLYMAEKRQREREVLESMVISRLRGMRGEMKSRGVGNGDGVGGFEDTAKSYYSSLSRYLSSLPSSPLPTFPPNIANPSTVTSTFPTPNNANTDLPSQTQTLTTLKFDLDRFDTYSNFLWMSPGTGRGTGLAYAEGDATGHEGGGSGMGMGMGMPALEMSVALITWLNGLLPEVPEVLGVPGVPALSAPTCSTSDEKAVEIPEFELSLSSPIARHHRSGSGSQRGHERGPDPYAYAEEIDPSTPTRRPSNPTSQSYPNTANSTSGTFPTSTPRALNQKRTKTSPGKPSGPRERDRDRDRGRGSKTHSVQHPASAISVGSGRAHSGNRLAHKRSRTLSYKLSLPSLGGFGPGGHAAGGGAGKSGSVDLGAAFHVQKKEGSRPGSGRERAVSGMSSYEDLGGEGRVHGGDGSGLSGLHAIKAKIRERMTDLAERREVLELAWTARDLCRIEMEQRVRQQEILVRALKEDEDREKELKREGRKSFGFTSARKMMDPAEGGSDRTMEGIEADRLAALSMLEGKRKGKSTGMGMGSKIRGMITSASMGGLTGRIGGSELSRVGPFSTAQGGIGMNALPSPSPRGEEERSVSQASSRMSLQIPSGQGSDLGKSRPKMSNRHSMQASIRSSSRSSDGRVSPVPGTIMQFSGGETYGALTEEPGAHLSADYPHGSGLIPSPDLSPSSAPPLLDNESKFPFKQSKFPAIRDLQGGTAEEVEEEEMNRQKAGRRKEGLVWSTGEWDEVSGVGRGGGGGGKGKEGKERARWEGFWMVLSSSKLLEYKGGVASKLQTPSQIVDLRFTTARAGRETDRRFTFEIVTPTQGKRVYQAASSEEAKSWIYAISNAIESALYGNGSLRSLHAGRSGDDTAASQGDFTRDQVGIGFPTSPGLEDLANHRRESGKTVPRIPSWKHALRQTRHSFGFMSGSKPPKPVAPDVASTSSKEDSVRSVSGSDTRSLGRAFEPSSEKERYLPRPELRSRHSSRSSENSAPFLAVSEEVVSDSSGGSRPRSRMKAVPKRPTSGMMTRQPSNYHMDFDEQMRSAILSVNAPEAEQYPESRSRTKSAGSVAQLKHSRQSSRSRSRTSHGAITPKDEDLPQAGEKILPAPPPGDMSLLRHLYSLPSNSTCADCRRDLSHPQAQRWATISLHNRPTCLFLCQRCAGIHRGLGSHISKVRSCDLDRWTGEMIEVGRRSGGNERGNGIWERRRRGDEGLIDLSLPSLKDFIEKKYAQGTWMNQEDRAYYFDQGGIAL